MEEEEKEGEFDIDYQMGELGEMEAVRGKNMNKKLKEYEVWEPSVTDWIPCISKAEVLELIILAYAKCNKCYKNAEDNNLKKREEHLDNFGGRLDELTILYSDIKGCNFNEAKEELKSRITGK